MQLSRFFARSAIFCVNSMYYTILHDIIVMSLCKKCKNFLFAQQSFLLDLFMVSGQMLSCCSFLTLLFVEGFSYKLSTKIVNTFSLFYLGIALGDRKLSFTPRRIPWNKRTILSTHRCTQMACMKLISIIVQVWLQLPTSHSYAAMHAAQGHSLWLAYYHSSRSMEGSHC